MPAFFVLYLGKSGNWLRESFYFLFARKALFMRFSSSMFLDSIMFFYTTFFINKVIIPYPQKD